jgi:hypothetical protein
VTSPRPRAVHLLALLPALAGFGCGGGMTNGNPIMPPPHGGTSGQMPMGTVAVVIDTPVAGAPAVFPGTLIDVSARVAVEGGTDFVDGTSVEVTVTEQGSMQAVDKGKLVITGGDVYAGRVSLGADLKGGTYTITVTARSSGGAVGTGMVDISVDAGPSITITAPVEGKSYKHTLTIEVIATDGVGLAVDPNGVTIPPSATVGITAVPLSPTGVADTYRGTIDFDSQDPPLFGSQLLTVAVMNLNGRRTEVQLIFFIDNEGPTITSTLPVPGQVAAGIVLISAKVDDPAGVLDSSVIAVIGDKTGTPLFELPMKPIGAGVYTVLFDSSRFAKCPDPPAQPCLVFPTISFRASDLVGNETIVGYEFTLDNVAPISDLDSANVRVVRKDGYCSQEFDPLSRNTFPGDMPNDGAVVPQVFDLRARIEDDGNSAATGLKVLPVAGIDPNATDVYILDDVSQVLIVDTDGDGYCDHINPHLVPTTQPPTQNDQVLKVRLAGVPGQGDADYRDDGKGAASCPYPPTALPPESICPGNQPFTTISGADNLPIIYSMEPITKSRCMGSQFDTMANHISEGWTCLAVQSSDLNGNTSVSSAMRIYINYNGSNAGKQASQVGLGTPPTCTGTYDKSMDKVTPGTCRTRGFDVVEYIYKQ